MNTLRKWWKLALAVVLVVVAAQMSVSLLVRTRRAHEYLIAHLERAFGRPIEVRQFEAYLLPSPLLVASGLTVGEDPAFGYEYFLRAERMEASLRWLGMLSGHFDFGTLSLTRPSLILVRNGEGRWNLESWLPPGKTGSASRATAYGPAALPRPPNRLLRIEFDDGRINFKDTEAKKAFAFTNVSGRVEQVSPGRWRLQLEAQPWRSGVKLQSSGKVTVTGDLAGTSARLQPAQLSVHWDSVSLADLFRLFRGQDYGLRGTFAMDGEAKGVATGESSAGDWAFSLQARCAEIHRWDLTERTDNPRVNVAVKGRWNVAKGNLTAEQFQVETPNSNVKGTAEFSREKPTATELRVDSIGIQGHDVLAWYRAFHPGVSDDTTVNQFFTGALRFRNWPLQLEMAAFSSTGGELKMPGLSGILRIESVRGGLQGTKLFLQPARVSLETEIPRVTSGSRAGSGLVAKRRSANVRSVVTVSAAHDFATKQGSISMDGRVENIAEILKIAAGFGRPLNHGWELTGAASGGLEWSWSGLSFHDSFGEPSQVSFGKSVHKTFGGPFLTQWNGRVAITKGRLQAAGLNQPVEVEDATLEWTNGERTVQLVKAQGFGAAWSGEVAEVGGAPSAYDSPSGATIYGSLSGVANALAARGHAAKTRAKNAASMRTHVSPGGGGGSSAIAMSELPPVGDQAAKWRFKLQTDHLDATELDRWVGPRARPSWLRRLLPSLLGSPAPALPASELLRRLNAEGEVDVERLTIEKLELTHARIQGSLRELQLDVSAAEAKWAGGKVLAKMTATFYPRPKYEVTAAVDGANLGQLPGTGRVAENLEGSVSGKVHLTASGVGRDELLQMLAGQGEVRLKKVELRGWDVSGSMTDGTPRLGSSQWTVGDGVFSVREGKIIVPGLRLDSGSEQTVVQGTINFDRSTNVTVRSASSVRTRDRSAKALAAAGHVLKISGSLDEPLVTVEKPGARQPAD